MNKQKEARQLAMKALENAPSISLLHDPIEYVFADQFRQRTLCNVLGQIADAETIDLELTTAAIEFLRNDFLPHVHEKEEELFPLLERRAEKEDEIKKVLERLCGKCASDEADGWAIVTVLEELVSPSDVCAIDKQAGELLKRFAANERHRLIVANAIVLPLARARLTVSDQKRLGLRMAARRRMKLG